ncbi:Uncharacterised protein [Acinetobacter baumannii]|nr:Uncharacterised protein [Acinetobacter baumannii]
MLLVVKIQRRRRLVEEQPGGGRLRLPQLRQYPRQLHSLLFAAGQLTIVALRQRQAIGLRHHLLDRLVLVAFAVRRASHADHFFHAEGKRQIAVLTHHGSDFGQLLRRPVFQRAAKQPAFAAVRRQIAGQQTQQRRFAGAVRADNRHHFTAGEAERNIVDQAARTEAVAQLPGREVGDVIHRFAPAGASPATRSKGRREGWSSIPPAFRPAPPACAPACR